MHFGHLHYFPLSAPFLAILFIIFGVLLILVQLGVIEYAYAKIGIQPRYVFLMLLLSLLGSYVNLPLYQLPARKVESSKTVSVYGVEWEIPEMKEQPATIIAINVGGALIPTILSIYLMIKNNVIVRSLVGVGIVAVIVHWLATPVVGVGIALPPLIPPLVAAGVAIMLSRRAAPAVAYISGSLGCLIGADLLNLDIVQQLNAPVLSIGGAGTFDGVFLTGIVAVILA
jgi:uncharacterized membrane protein